MATDTTTENRFSFTHARLDKLICPPSGRPERDGRTMFYDTQIKSLALRVTETGTKSFYWVARIGQKVRKLHIGDYPATSIDAARSSAGKYNDKRAQGIDPTEEKRTEREKQAREATIGELWASYRDHWLANKKPGPIKNITQLYERHIAKWNGRTVASIDLADVERLKNQIGEESKITANRVIEIIRAMYRRRGHQFGLARGYSPTAGIDFYPEKVRDRVLSTLELSKVLTAIDGEENYIARDCFKMLIYTGQRKNTVCRMAWQDLNIDGATWKIPGEKTKNGKPLVVNLIPEAIAVLKYRYENNPTDSPYVFPSRNFTPAIVEQAKAMRANGNTTRQIAAELKLSQTAVMHILSPLFVQRGSTPFGGASKAWGRIVKRAGVAHATIHDIRRSFCTSLIERGVPLPIVAAAMGHRDIATTQRHYAFASDKAVADATRASMAGLLKDVTKAQKQTKAAKSA